MVSRTRDHGTLYRIAGLCLKAERQGKRILQSELAPHLGMSTDALSSVETGHSRLRLDTLLQACAVMGTDPAALVANIVRLAPDVPRETSRRTES